MATCSSLRWIYLDAKADEASENLVPSKLILGKPELPEGFKEVHDRPRSKNPRRKKRTAPVLSLKVLG
jgi:hypothetical protein